MRFWVGWLSDGQSLESPVDKKSCLKSGFQERRLRLAPRREEGAGGKWRELVVGLAAAAQTEGGGARAARACVRTCVRARTPPSLRPQSPGGTRQHPGLPRPPPTADSATSPPRQGPRLFPARRFRHSGSPSAPTPAARRPSNRKLLCPDRLREAAGAAQAQCGSGGAVGGE